MSLRGLPVGTILLDRYQILDSLAAGGFAVVYKARQASTGQLVAVKILTAQGAHMEAERFEREMQVLAQLKHPNIVQLVDCGRLDGNPFMVLEFVEGRELSDELKQRGPLQAPFIRRIFSQSEVETCGIRFLGRRALPLWSTRPPSRACRRVSPQAGRRFL